MAANRIFPVSTRTTSDVFEPVVAVAQLERPLSVVYIPAVPNCAQWQQHLFQIAYEWARAALAPPRHEQLLTASWN